MIKKQLHLKLPFFEVSTTTTFSVFQKMHCRAFSSAARVPGGRELCLTQILRKNSR